MLAPVYNVTFFFHFEITFHCDQFLMCVVVGQPGYVVLHELCVCGFWSTQKENEKYGNEVGTLTSTTTSIFSDKLLFLSSDTEKRRRQFVTWISLYQNVQKWSDHRCTTIFRNKEDYAWWNDPAKCFFFIFMFTLVFLC